jgi:hypothetical protein
MRRSTLAAFTILATLASCDRDASVSAPETSPSAIPTSDDAAARVVGELGSIDSASDLVTGMQLEMPEVYLPGASDVSALAVGTKPVAGRGAASSDRFEVDFSDTAKGRVTVSATKQLPNATAYDTLVVGWKDGKIDTTSVYSLRGKRVGTSGTTESYSIVPVVAGRTLATGKVRLEGVRTLPGGLGSKVAMIADAGPDGDLNAGSDNRVWSIEWIRRNGADTIAKASIRPWDPSRPLSGPGASPLFAAQAWEGRVPAHPRHDVSWKMVARVSGTDTLAVSFSAARRWIGGRRDTLWTENVSNPDSALAWPGDTVRVVHVGERPAGDSFATVRIEVLSHLVGGIGREGNLVGGLLVDRDHRVGAVSRSRFSWIAKTEVPEGKDPVDGSIDLRLDLVDGRKASLVGEFDASGFKTVWTSPDGDTVKVEKKNG